MTFIDNQRAGQACGDQVVMECEDMIRGSAAQGDLRAGSHCPIGGGVHRACLKAGKKAVEIGMTGLGDRLALRHANIAAQNGIEPQVISEGRRRCDWGGVVDFTDLRHGDFPCCLVFIWGARFLTQGVWCSPPGFEPGPTVLGTAALPTSSGRVSTDIGRNPESRNRNFDPI